MKSQGLGKGLEKTEVLAFLEQLHLILDGKSLTNLPFNVRTQMTGIMLSALSILRHLMVNRCLPYAPDPFLTFIIKI